MNTKTVSISLLLSLLLFLCSCTSNKENRLAKASSPYLQQHADNPVDWYEWGDEALAIAKKENKPLLISVGYASCHWCHVMERESFMDTGVARIMNENFICIKVDREERPDIDNIYMNACQLISGSSGWPLNAFAMPDGKPFFAGTYYSRQSWISLLTKISSAYKNQNGKIRLQALSLTQGISNESLALIKPDEERSLISKQQYESLFDTLYSQLDLRNGGLKGAPKFPMPSVNEFLLQFHHLTGDKKALEAATNSLSKMALGSIYDQVGGGFARYATDSLWRVPHFEKMLYDNGQLLSLYAHAYQVTKNAFFKNMISEVASFLDRDLGTYEGGFYSSLNAETKDGEGDFYAWELAEIRKITGEQHATLVSKYFNISEKGNWKDQKNILYANQSPQEYAASENLSLPDFYNQLSAGKKALLLEREKREKPSVDKKLLTSWNALALKGYADAYVALGEKSFLDKATNIARFIEKNMMGKDGHLWRTYTNGKTSIDGFLDDYALLAKSFIRLYQVTFDIHWLTLSKQLADYALTNFYDEKSGMFYYTASTTKGLVVRKIEIVDNVIPSSNGVMAEVLFNLATYFDTDSYLQKSSRMVSTVSGKPQANIAFYTQWAFVAGLFSHGTNEVAIIGKDAVARNIELQKNYLPNCIFLGDTVKESLPLLDGKLSENKTLLYVCTNKTCKSPVEDAGQAYQQLTKNRIF